MGEAREHANLSAQIALALPAAEGEPLDSALARREEDGARGRETVALLSLTFAGEGTVCEHRHAGSAWTLVQLGDSAARQSAGATSCSRRRAQAPRSS